MLFSTLHIVSRYVFAISLYLRGKKRLKASLILLFLNPTPSSIPTVDLCHKFTVRSPNLGLILLLLGFISFIHCETPTIYTYFFGTLMLSFWGDFLVEREILIREGGGRSSSLRCSLISEFIEVWFNLSEILHLTAACGELWQETNQQKENQIKVGYI